MFNGKPKVAAQCTLPSTAAESYPYSVSVDRPKDSAYVSLWGKSQVVKVDLTSAKVVKTYETQSHPTEMILLDEGKLMAVACSNQNSVVMIDTERSV